MKIPQQDTLRERLCAEYALGTLRGGARRRFEQWLLVDAGLRRSVAEWQDRLAPMAGLTPAQLPSERLWQAIEAATVKRQRSASMASRAPGMRGANEPGMATGWLGRLFGSVVLWRGIAAAALIAIPFSLYVARFNPSSPPGTQLAQNQSWIAVLNDGAQQPMMAVRIDAAAGTVHLRRIGPAGSAPQGALELWAIPKQGHPRSLGMLPADATMPLQRAAWAGDVTVLAVSVEQPGGSKNPEGPTGPVVWTGTLVNL